MSKTRAKMALGYKSSLSEGSNDDDEDAGKRIDVTELKTLKDRVKHLDEKWDNLLAKNKRLKAELRKVRSSISRGTKGEIRKDNDWNGEEVNLLDRAGTFCCHYLFSGFKFLSDDWQLMMPRLRIACCTLFESK
jgi:hypothetical protein